MTSTTTLSARAACALLSLGLLGGCAGGSDLDDPEHVRAWANSASALAVFLPAYDPVAIADGQLVPDDPSCPTLTDDGTTLVITGGCVDAAGAEWIGAATVVRDGSGGFAVTLEGFGKADEDPAGVTGTIVITQTATDAHTFEADYAQRGLLELDVVYAGSVEGGWDGATVWNGAGTVTRGGFTDASGTSTATTVDQRRDPGCTNQSWSGRTTITHEGRTLVIDYDGETDCDEDHSARYSVDGEDRGSIDGISCAVTPGGGRPAAGFALALALGVLVARRGRRRTSSTGC